MANPPDSRPVYPPAERLDVVEELHGRRVADPYRWLEDAADPRTVAWSSAQDALFTECRRSWTARPVLRARLAELFGGEVGAPSWRRGRPFFLRRRADQEHAVLLTADPDGTERVLIDPMALDPGGTTTLDQWYPSLEGDRLAYLLSEGGTERSSLWVLDVATGATVEGPIDRARHTTVGWLPGATEFYYMRHLPADAVTDDDAYLHRRVYLHRVGTEAGEDVLIYGEGLPRGRYYHPAVSPDGRWLLLGSAQGTDPRNDVWLADLVASTPDAPALRPLQEGVDALVMPVVRNGRLFAWTDRDAPRGRICLVEPDRLSYDAWHTLVSEDPEAVLTDFVVLDGAQLPGPVLVLAWLRHAVSEVTVHDAATGERIAQIPLPGLGTVSQLTAPLSGGHEMWFRYEDFATPGTVFRYDGLSGDVSVWARPPDSAAAAGIATRQVVYASRDGTPVRMFVVSRADQPPEPHPTILYGYGGFNIALTPWHGPGVMAWVGAGGVYAVANLRGGKEEGEQWHRAGMLANKQNVFDDLHAAADRLVADGVTTPDRLAIYGGSNGGLLVGAALTQHPDRYAAVVCSAPLLDMLRYELFGLGSTWSGEYGSVDDPEQFGWLRAYSPYHNVHSGVPYPAVLFAVFEGDTRVDPLHARKLAAALQHATSSARPILVRRETEVGHAARAVSRLVDLYADQLAFLAHELSLPLPDSAGGPMDTR
jgi:prolyl oligopeptidase